MTHTIPETTPTKDQQSSTLSDITSPSYLQILLDQHGSDPGLDSRTRLAQLHAQKLARIAQAWVGLAAACAMVFVFHHANVWSWTVAVLIGATIAGILTRSRRSAACWPIAEVVAGSVLCLASMPLPFLLEARGLDDSYLVVAPITCAVIIGILATLTSTRRTATIINRALFTAVPPIATALHMM
jgi:hypothetical protein